MPHSILKGVPKCPKLSVGLLSVAEILALYTSAFTESFLSVNKAMMTIHCGPVLTSVPLFSSEQSKQCDEMQWNAGKYVGRTLYSEVGFSG